MSSSSSSNRLVQTTLTSAFFRPPPRDDVAEKRVAYFAKPIKENFESSKSSAALNDDELPNNPDPEQSPKVNARRRNAALAEVAKETKAVLPNILEQLEPDVTTNARLYVRKDVDRLNQKYCPGFALPSGDPKSGAKGTRVRVIDEDSFNAAIALQMQTGTDKKKPVAVLNLASEKNPGGGWLKGALAQEEALCYRSSLSFTLKRRFYPLPDISCIYSATVVIIRDAIDKGHALLYPTISANNLPVVSVISVAAKRNPSITTTSPRDYTWTKERDMTKSKIRMILRIAALNGHRQLVLGALGCGAFKNPPEGVAQCFKEVFEEGEFGGGWWEDVVFAVMDDRAGAGTDGDGNFGIFWRALNDVIV